MTARENAMLAYRHKQPQWIPGLFTDISIMFANPHGERYYGQESGKDWFGVDWTYVPDMMAPMPTPGKELFTDITRWRDAVKFPDLDAIDWEAQADIDSHTDAAVMATTGKIVRMPDGKSVYDDDKLILCMVLNGPFERMHSLITFENALMSLVTEPDACSDFFGAVALSTTKK